MDELSFHTNRLRCVALPHAFPKTFKRLLWKLKTRTNVCIISDSKKITLVWPRLILRKALFRESQSSPGKPRQALIHRYASSSFSLHLSSSSNTYLFQFWRNYIFTDFYNHVFLQPEGTLGEAMSTYGNKLQDYDSEWEIHHIHIVNLALGKAPNSFLYAPAQ